MVVGVVEVPAEKLLLAAEDSGCPMTGSPPTKLCRAKKAAWDGRAFGLRRKEM